MQVVKADPPLIDEIDKAFKVKGKPVFFAFGDTLYNPAGVTIPPELLVHENVHGMRQKQHGFTADSGVPLETRVELWWRRYISDRTFRLDEEIPAHAAEFWHIARNSNRNVRRTALSRIAKRLSGPLYGKLISREDAKRLLNALALQLEHGRLKLDTFGDIRAPVDHQALQDMQANRPGRFSEADATDAAKV